MHVAPNPFPLDGWKRQDFVRTAVMMGLNGPQISALSLSTPRPMKTSQQVYDAIESAGLDKVFRSKKIERRRKGDHNQNIIRVFMKLYGQALELGCTVTDVCRDEAPCEGARMRPDLGMRIVPRLFFEEIQLSKIQYTRWHAKMKGYVRLYETLGEPFRALFLVDRDADVPRLRQYAREVLSRDHPDLNLFYFLTLKDFFALRDVVKGRVWHGAWNSLDRFALMG